MNPAAVSASPAYLDSLASDKELTLNYHRHTLRFRVSQELFSSYQIDAGTRLLLKTVSDLAASEDVRKVLDLGCGYGPLGLAAMRGGKPAAEALGELIAGEFGEAANRGEVVVELVGDAPGQRAECFHLVRLHPVQRGRFLGGWWGRQGGTPAPAKQEQSTRDDEQGGNGDRGEVGAFRKNLQMRGAE